MQETKLDNGFSARYSRHWNKVVWIPSKFLTSRMFAPVSSRLNELIPVGSFHEGWLILSAERIKRWVLTVLWVLIDPHGAAVLKVAEAVSECHEGIGSKMWGQYHSIDGPKSNVVHQTIFAACYYHNVSSGAKLRSFLSSPFFV